eukprot:scpid93241/ scgid32504/ 
MLWSSLARFRPRSGRRCATLLERAFAGGSGLDERHWKLGCVAQDRTAFRVAQAQACRTFGHPGQVCLTSFVCRTCPCMKLRAQQDLVLTSHAHLMLGDWLIRYTCQSSSMHAAHSHAALSHAAHPAQAAAAYHRACQQLRAFVSLGEKPVFITHPHCVQYWHVARAGGLDVRCRLSSGR